MDLPITGEDVRGVGGRPSRPVGEPSAGLLDERHRGGGVPPLKPGIDHHLGRPLSDQREPVPVAVAPLPVGPRQPRRVEVVTDVRWVRRYLLPWVGRRVRGVSSGDNRAAKHVELVDVVPD